jgi:hypothetical protein
LSKRANFSWWWRVASFAAIVVSAIGAIVIFSEREGEPEWGAREPEVVDIRFEPDPFSVGARVTLVWEVRGAESVSIPPVADGLEPDLGQYTFVATRESVDNLRFVASNQHGRVELVLATFEHEPARQTPAL